MHRNRVTGYSKNPPPAMPRSPNRIVAVAVNHLSPDDDDDDDDDICPVCDGACTCNKRPPLQTAGHGIARFVTTPIAPMRSSAHAPAAQPLKIKITVPPGIQNKARSLGSAQTQLRMEGASAPSPGVTGSNPTSSRPTSSTAGHGQRSPSDAIGPKRKGRPLKPVATARDSTPITSSDLRNFGNEATTLPQSQSHLSSHTHSHKFAASRATRLQARGSKSKLAASRLPSKSQAKGTIAKRSVSSKKEQDLHDSADSDIHLSDASSGHFPTFVSADGLTSEASESSESGSDSESAFGSDLELAAEEKNYIVAEQRRHDKARILRELLGDDAPKHKDPNNRWVIRPRKKSVGLSDVDMEGDSDEVTEEDDEDDEEMDEDEEDDEADDQASRVYTGLATGWSDDEESNFDADLFFTNLTDTSDDDSSETDGSHLHDSATNPLANSVNSLRSADLEVTEAWDGQVVFTNGSNGDHGILDLAFEANAAQLLASDCASVSQSSDVEMRTSDDAGDELDGDSEFGGSDGDTTEEELVDEHGLPTSHAMKLFQSPFSISSIDPMSTVSPNISPASFSRRYPLSTSLDSPRPADILAGKVIWEETDQPHPDSAESSGGASPRSIARVCVPIMGEFCLASPKAVVLTGVNKDVPSPYPRRRRRFSSSAGSFSSMDLRGRTARLSIYSSLPPPSDEPSSETPPDITLGEPIKLDDVLDPTFLDSEPEMQTQTISDSEGEQRLARSLSRWDRVPVGAFRFTTSDVPLSPGWTSEPAKSSVPGASYGNVLKNSPLHTMLWSDKSVKQNQRKSRGANISPVLLPVRDGDRTPTHVPYHHDLHSNHRQQQQQQQQHPPFKSRKESRRERKMLKRKTHAPTYQHYDHHQRHHRRNHHPNMKTRGNASAQRTFFSSPTSAPALSI